jgi:hypothetical protein
VLSATPIISPRSLNQPQEFHSTEANGLGWYNRTCGAERDTDHIVAIS